MAILIMPNLQLGSEHSLGLAWELSAFEFGVSEGATSVIFTGPLLAGGAPTDEADVVLKPALARFDDCLLVAKGDLGCKAHYVVSSSTPGHRRFIVRPPEWAGYVYVRSRRPKGQWN